MKRLGCAFILLALAVAATFVEARTPFRADCIEWLATCVRPAHPQYVTAVQMPDSGKPIPSLDAALILRAALRYSPKEIVFLVPIEKSDAASALSSQLSDAKAPVSFSPPKDDGAPVVGAVAARYVRRIDFGQLMVRNEQSEQGTIGGNLDALFRDSVVVVQSAWDKGALRIAALANRLTEQPAPPWIYVLCVLPALTLPWWRGSRQMRFLFALVAACGWLLIAQAVYQEFQIPMPLLAMLLLPLPALIPSATSANKAEQGKLPA